MERDENLPSKLNGDKDEKQNLVCQTDELSEKCIQTRILWLIRMQTWGSRLLGQVSETVLAEEVIGKGRELGKEQNRAREKKGRYR